MNSVYFFPNSPDIGKYATLLAASTPKTKFPARKESPDKTQTAVAVSQIQYDRDMGLLIGPESTPATLSFPPSVRWVRSRAFERAKQLRGIVPNEGLEEL